MARRNLPRKTMTICCAVPFRKTCTDPERKQGLWETVIEFASGHYDQFFSGLAPSLSMCQPWSLHEALHRSETGAGCGQVFGSLRQANQPVLVGTDGHDKQRA